MDDELAEVVVNIRACIQTSKDPTPVRFLARDYDTLAGGEIPYRKFNHPTLESFLRSLDSLEVIGAGRDAAVIARRSAQSGHMLDLIGKTPKPKNKKPYRPAVNFYQPRGRGAASRGSGRGNSYPPRGSYHSYRGNSHSSRGSFSTRDYAPPRNNVPVREYPENRDYSEPRSHSRHSPDEYAPPKNNMPKREYSEARDYSEPRPYPRHSPEPLRGSSNYPASRNVPAPSEEIASRRWNGYDPNDEREPGPEDIVIKLEENKRQVCWNRDKTSMLITVSRNQDYNNLYQRQGFNHYNSKNYY